MSLTLANMLTRVKRNVPTTTMDTELQDKLLERMNYLTTLDIFPFQEKYQYATLPSGEFRIVTPNDFGIVKSLGIWEGDLKQREIVILDATEFTEMFPKPDEEELGVPSYACIRVAESELWFDCPADGDLTLRMEFYYIPSDVTDTTINQLTEMAKLAVIDWASAEGFRMMGQHDNASMWEGYGDKKFMAIEKRYQRALEHDSQFISPKMAHTLKRN